MNTLMKPALGLHRVLPEKHIVRELFQGHLMSSAMPFLTPTISRNFEKPALEFEKSVNITKNAKQRANV